MKTIRTQALLATAAVCLLVEGIVLAVVYAYFKSLAGAVAFSLIVLGPVSLWIAPPLQRHFSRP